MPLTTRSSLPTQALNAVCRLIVLGDATPNAEIVGPIDTLILVGGPGAESGIYDPEFIA